MNGGWGGGWGGGYSAPYAGQSFPSPYAQMLMARSQQAPQQDGMPMMPGMPMGMMPGMGGGGGAGGGGAGGAMSSLGPIAAIMAAVAATKGAEARNPDSLVGKLGRTFNAPSGAQIAADPKVGMTTALGIPFINNWIMNDKAKKARPEWEGLLGGLFGG